MMWCTFQVDPPPPVGIGFGLLASVIRNYFLCATLPYCYA